MNLKPRTMKHLKIAIAALALAASGQSDNTSSPGAK
jgi:hypothetical protein